ncbi:MAG: endopeptidase La, partial [Clostridia bacterium]|nr:endopeptidase La [Clostridia bacterium]
MTEKMKINIPTVALRGLCIYPGILFHFDIGRPRSIKAIEKAMNEGQEVFLVTQRDIENDDPSMSALYEVGTLCRICQVLRVPGDTLRVLVEGLSRAHLDDIHDVDPYIRSTITLIDDEPVNMVTKRDIALLRRAKELFFECASIGNRPQDESYLSIVDNEDLGYVSDFIAHYTSFKFTEKQSVLDELNPRRRLSVLCDLLLEEMKVRSIEQELSDKVKENMEKNERYYYLREQIKVISEELGDGEDGLSESQAYIEKIKALGLDEESEQKLCKEANRLSKMQPSSPESAVIRGYLDICVELPWNIVKKENNDIRKAKKILEADHFGMDKVKERILEFFAVKKLTGGVKGQIICLVGPPGVGKTSIGRSIASAMGRDFARLSLGGVKDEADIRGHRKTYIGAMPGRIINAIKQAGSRNCLILVDEIDKLGSDYKGDPSSALLEVFDTEQNNAFRDHFVELPFDLSDVLFITTANDRDAIPVPLLDRMEIIELTGYTDEEKLQIAKKHLIPKQLEKHGLTKKQVIVDNQVLRRLICEYTKESGVRNLERRIALLCRKAAKSIVEDGVESVKYTSDNLESFIGIPKYKRTQRDNAAECGVVSGLAWTSVGGEMLEVEAVALEGTGKLELTGNLGDVMKESVRAALTYLRSRREKFGLAADFYSKNDIHIHFPEGAGPKAGPSAG